MTVTCDSCDHTTESPKPELLDNGWQWIDLKDRTPLILCGLCVGWYERRRVA